MSDESDNDPLEHFADDRLELAHKIHVEQSRDAVKKNKGSDCGKTDAIHEFYRRRELDTDTSELLEILRDENGIEHSLAVSVLATILEHRAKIPGYGVGGVGGVGYGDVATVRGQLSKLHDMQDRAFRHYEKYVFEHHGQRQMAWRCVMLLLDFKFMAGGESLKQIVEVCGGDAKNPSQYRAIKATVNKCLASFQKAVPELPRIPVQRTAAARKAMQVAQEKIWRS
jgi:hypothetical protein